VVVLTCWFVCVSVCVSVASVHCGAFTPMQLLSMLTSSSLWKCAHAQVKEQRFSRKDDDGGPSRGGDDVGSPMVSLRAGLKIDLEDANVSVCVFMSWSLY